MLIKYVSTQRRYTSNDRAQCVGNQPESGELPVLYTIDMFNIMYVGRELSINQTN